jgi:hypothetical protein
MSAADQRWARLLGYIREHGVKTGLEILVNFALPFLIYDHWRSGLGDVKALMASSIPPILWSIVEFIRLRKIDAISVLVVAGIVLSLVAFIGGGGVKVLQLRENLVTGLIGLVFLGSAAIGRPVVYELARANMRRRGPDGARELEAVRHNVHVRRVINTSTVVCGGWPAGNLRRVLRAGVHGLDQDVPADQRADQLCAGGPADRLERLVRHARPQAGRGARGGGGAGQCDAGKPIRGGVTGVR